MKNRNAKLLCLALVLALVLTIALAACNPKAETPDALVTSLKTSLKNYLASEKFTTAKSAATTQDRVPLMYSRYIIGNIYTDSDAELLKTNLQKIDSVIDKNGNLIRQNAYNRFVLFVHRLLKIQPLEKGERTIVFVEVKTRCDSGFGTPEEAVTPYKAGRYVTAAKSYLSQKRICGANVRFDIIAIDDEGIRHIENAFNENDAKYARK